MYLKKDGRAGFAPWLPRSLSAPVVAVLVVAAYLGGYLHAARDSRGEQGRCK